MTVRKLITRKPAEDKSEDASAATAAKSEAVDPVAAAVASLRSLTDVQLTAVWTAYELAPLLRTMPPAWRVELARCVAGLRLDSKGREAALLRESEILRQALGQIRIAGMAETASEHAKHAENQALAALRTLATAIASIDVDRITIIERYAKANRCSTKNAKVNRGGKKARRAA